MGEALPTDGVSHSSNLETVTSAREKAWGRPVHIISLGTKIKLPPSRYPYLVALEGAEDAWLEASLDMAWDERCDTWKDGLKGSGRAVHRIGGWLRSAVSATELAQLLGEWMQLRTTQRVKESYLRVADPRVFSLLRTVLGDAVLREHMGRLQQWLYLDANGLVQSLNSAGTANDNRDPTFPYLTPEQWQQLILGAIIHPAVGRAYGQRRASPADDIFLQTDDYPSALAAAARFADISRAKASWAEMVSPYIRSEEDLTTAVALTLLNPRWETHPGVLTLLADGEGAQTLTKKCLDIHACSTHAEPQSNMAFSAATANRRMETN